MAIKSKSYKVGLRVDDFDDKIKSLQTKYKLTGQSTSSYLEGLLLSNYVGYWDYIQLETLLSLQRPKTDFPDEQIFITYHQITELYFKLCLHELNQIRCNGVDISADGEVKGSFEELDPDFFKVRLKRLITYFDCLIDSFSVMIDGMEQSQFTKFRMALLPASGFQSYQYRCIEIASTDLVQLVSHTEREKLYPYIPQEEVFDLLYWKKGAKDDKTGKKTYTLEQFEKKYGAELLAFSKQCTSNNLWQKFQTLDKESKVDEELKSLLKQYDQKVNFQWPMMHLKSAAKYLTQKKGAQGTGGTNWKKYLPPRFQKRLFYPDLYSKEELENWGG